jgi:hypothetical protein
MRRAVVLGLVTLMGVTACGGHDHPAALTDESSASLSGRVPSVVPPHYAPPETPGVRVDADIDVRQSPATRAVVSYTREHAASVIDGTATARLSQLVSGPLFNYQLGVIADAHSHGWTVPDRPRLRIVDVRTTGSTATLDVCYWFPSVGYVDTVTGEPVDPSATGWTPAVVSVDKQATGGSVSWIVGKVGGPGATDDIDCGGSA